MSTRNQKLVFLSFTGQDDLARHFTGILHEKLERYNRIATFYDTETINVGAELRERIKQGVRECKLFVCILTPSFFSRKWCMRELDWAFRFERTILPFQLTDQELPIANDESIRHVMQAHRRAGQSPEIVDRWTKNLERLDQIKRECNFSTTRNNWVIFSNQIVETIQSKLEFQHGLRDIPPGTLFEIRLEKDDTYGQGGWILKRGTKRDEESYYVNLARQENGTRAYQWMLEYNPDSGMYRIVSTSNRRALSAKPHNQKGIVREKDLRDDESNFVHAHEQAGGYPWEITWLENNVFTICYQMSGRRMGLAAHRCSPGIDYDTSSRTKVMAHENDCHTRWAIRKVT